MMTKLNAKQVEYLNQCIILIDTREQRPLTFRHETKRVTLKTGDYSIAGPDGREFNIAIERKTIDDFVNTAIHNRERFKRELERSLKLDYFAIVIEAALRDIADHFYMSKAEPKAVIQSLISWSIRYKAHIWLADNRQFAERIVESLLEKFVRGILIKEGI